MSDAPDPIVDFVDSLPDLVKLTVAGMAIDPPTVDVETSEPNFVFALDFLVRQGVAVATNVGSKRTYHLTVVGQEVAHEVSTRRLSDGSISANDNDDEGPAAA